MINEYNYIKDKLRYNFCGSDNQNNNKVTFINKKFDLNKLKGGSQY